MKRAVVLDASITIGSCIGETEAAELADAVLDLLFVGSAVVPGIWLGEVANALVSRERTKRRELRLATAEVTAFLRFIEKLPVVVDWTSKQGTFSRVAEVARMTGLTVYDAHYLELAEKLELPLGSLDDELREVADAAGVRLLTKELLASWEGDNE